MEDNIQTLKKLPLYLIIDISREVDDEVRSNAFSLIFDREFLGPLPWEEIHQLEDEYFKSKVYQLFPLF